MKHYIVQHVDFESSIASYFSVQAESVEDAVKKAELYTEKQNFTCGSLETPMEATEEEVKVMNKFGILS